MKKSLTAAAIALALALCLGAAFAAGGDASDPLVSLSYLEGMFSQSLDVSIDSHLDSADKALREDTQKGLDSLTASAQAAAGRNFAAQAQEADCKEGDVLTGSTGLTVVPLAGDLRLSLSHGAVVDATEGCEVPSGTLLSSGHRYIVAEDSLAHFTAASPAVALSYQGNYAFSPSDDSPDYFAIARALRSLGLFKGTGSGYGEGFDLHLTPTRGEGLVMFIRLLGEEESALTCSFTHPFTDVPDWLDRYVAWAFHQGYTNGVGSGKFGTTQSISAQEYQEFLLRALGYSVAGIHDYATSLERSLELGTLTSGEYQMLKEDPFLRAQVAYVSYYALDMVLSGSQQTLAQHLENAGVFTGYQLTLVRNQTDSLRLS